MIMLIETLQQYGFSEKEAKVYLAGLSLGSAPGSTIARHAGENRVTVYSILKEFQKKGIFSTIIRQGVTYFSPVSPEGLVRIVEEKYESMKAKLPEFLAIMDKSNNKPKIQFFEGLEGLKNMYNNLLEHKEPVYAFLSDDEMNSDIKNYLNTEYITKRRNNTIQAFVIVSDSIANEEYRKTTLTDPLTTVKVSKGKFLSTSGEILLYGKNSVAVALYKDNEMSGFVVESIQFYDSMKNIFMFVWENIHE